MKFIPISNGDEFPELYQLVFSGTHLQIIMRAHVWHEHFAGNFNAITPWVNPPEQSPSPQIDWEVCGTTYDVSFEVRNPQTREELAVVDIPVFPKTTNVEKSVDNARQYTKTIHEFLVALTVLTVEKERPATWSPPWQLMHAETRINELPGGYEPEVTLSPRACQALERITDEQIHIVSRSMLAVLRSYGRNDQAYLSLHGGVAILKAGDASIGPESGDRSYIRGHNVSSPIDQLVILVGLAVLWQMVREDALHA